MIRPAAASVLFGALCILAACAGHERKPPPLVTAAPTLTASYAAAARAGASVYRLNAGASTVHVLVDKAGLFSGVGHRHVVTVAGLRGFARLDSNGAGHADLSFPVAALVPDPVAAQKIYPHYSMPSAEDIAGTRAHMLGPVLDSKRYPWVTLHIQGRIDGASPVLLAAITLHGIRHKLKIGGKFTRHGSDLTAQGEFSIKQSAFGITPYSVMLGALRVKDTLQIRYHLVFNAWCPAPPSAKGTTC
ncbi:MAG: YceI family protein [Gammaproteobacteria bacterium]